DRHGEGQRVVVGAEVVDVRAGDMAAPGPLRYVVPRHRLIVVEVLAAWIGVDDEAFGGAVAEHEPLEPPPVIGQGVDRGYEAGALDPAGRVLEHWLGEFDHPA